MTLWRRNGATAEWESEAFLEGIDKPGNGIPEFNSDIAGTRLPSGEELVFVGAQNGGDDGGSVREGSAYAFVRAPSAPPGPDAWTREARLLAPDGAEGDLFGTAVAILPTPDLPGGHPGDVLALIGARRYMRGVTEYGAVYAFVRDGATGTWAFEQRFEPAAIDIADYFGDGLAVQALPGGAPGEALALGGAQGDDRPSIRVGAVYAFRRERDAASPTGFQWVEEATLRAEPQKAGLRFGASLALAADTLSRGTPGAVPIALALVGADPEGTVTGHPSEASLFARTLSPDGEPVWTRRAVYSTGDEGPQAADWFGHAVAFAPGPEGPLALVGAYYSNAAQEQGFPDAGLGAGAVFVYESRTTVAAEPESPSGAGVSIRVQPNPIAGETEVRFSVSASGRAEVSVYDVLGRRVATLQDGVLSAGEHVLRWQPSGLAPGVYVLRVATSAGSRSRTATLVR